jgi:hypothetical protein
LSGPGKQSRAEEPESDASQLPAARFFFQNCDAQQPRQGRTRGYEWDNDSGTSRSKREQVADRGHPTNHIPDDGEKRWSSAKFSSLPLPRWGEKQADYDLDGGPHDK